MADSSTNPEARTPILAIISLILGLLSLVTGFVAGIPAIICGHLSLVKIRKHGLEKGRGFAISGLILGYFMTIFAPPMLFFGASKAMNAAKNADASNTAYNLRNAMAAYYTEYRRAYPGEEIAGIAYTDGKFMAGLLGVDTEISKQLNPRGIVFFSSRIAIRTSDGKLRGGVLIDATGTGTLWDPWGNPYRAEIKPRDDGFASILVWSPGPDGKDGTKDDLRAE